MLTELGHLARTSWLHIFLYDSDSLTLPVIRQSLAHKEQILWVFSAQLNLFPEGILYALSSLFTSSIRSSLIINAVLNVVLFYVLIRLIIKVFSKRERVVQQITALTVSLLLVVYMLLEVQSIVPLQGFATYFLFTTYYYGLILVGLLAIYIILRQLKSSLPIRDNKNIITSVILAAITTLVVASNPLYTNQFLLPILLVSLLLMLVRLIKTRQFVMIAIPQIIGLLCGFLLRASLLKPFIGQSIGSHVSLSAGNYLSSTFYLLLSFMPTVETTGAKIRLIVSIAVYFTCLFYALFSLNSYVKTKKTNMSNLSLFVLLFAAFEPILLALSLIGTDEGQQRYLIASLIVPLIGLTVIADSKKIAYSLKKHSTHIIMFLSLVTIVAGSLSIPSVNKLLSPSTLPDEQCLEKNLDYKPANGLADYWSSRPLDVYNSYNERVLEYNSNSSVFPWLNNLATYENKKFTFIIVSRTLPPSESLTKETNERIGNASKIIACPKFYIYEYSPGTKAYTNLNNEVDYSLYRDIKARAAGDIEKYTFY